LTNVGGFGPSKL